MLYYERIDMGKGIDLAKTNNSKECKIWHYRFFNHGFEFQDSRSNFCPDLMMLSASINNIDIITVKNVDYYSWRLLVYIKTYCPKIQSIQNSFFNFFCLVYINGW